jgi:hypothetical protein
MEYEEIFNSIFFVLAFGLISFVYTLVTDNIAIAKKQNDVKTNIFSIGVVVLLVLYVLYDDKLVGGLPGINLIPVQIRKLMNIALKINSLRDGNNYNFINNLKSNLTANNQVSEADVDNLVYLSRIALKSIPKPAQMFIDRFKDKTQLLDKMLGPVDLKNTSQISNFMANPLIKMMLTIVGGNYV